MKPGEGGESWEEKGGEEKEIPRKGSQSAFKGGKDPGLLSQKTARAANEREIA